MPEELSYIIGEKGITPIIALNGVINNERGSFSRGFSYVITFKAMITINSKQGYFL